MAGAQLLFALAAMVFSFAYVELAAAGPVANHGCVVTSSGGVKCWGANGSGRLGDGTTTDRTTPVDVLTAVGGAALSGVAQVSTGGSHSCALTSSGGVKCWGLNNNGQLGDGTTTNRSTAVVRAGCGQHPVLGLRLCQLLAVTQCGAPIGELRADSSQQSGPGQLGAPAVQQQRL